MPGHTQASGQWLTAHWGVGVSPEKHGWHSQAVIHLPLLCDTLLS